MHSSLQLSSHFFFLVKTDEIFLFPFTMWNLWKLFSLYLRCFKVMGMYKNEEFVNTNDTMSVSSRHLWRIPGLPLCHFTKAKEHPFQLDFLRIPSVVLKFKKNSNNLHNKLGVFVLCMCKRYPSLCHFQPYTIVIWLYRAQGSAYSMYSQRFLGGWGDQISRPLHCGIFDFCEI